MPEAQKGKSKTNIALIVIIAILAVTILYDLFGGSATAPATQEPAAEDTNQSVDVPIESLSVYNVTYDNDTNKLYVTLENEGSQPINLVGVRIAKVDMDPQSFVKEFKFTLSPEEVRKLKITPPQPFHKIDLLSAKPNEASTIWHEGPISVANGAYQINAQKTETTDTSCELIESVEYFDVHYNQSENKVHFTIENIGNQTIAFNAIRIAEVNMDPDSYTKPFNLTLQPGETKEVEVTPPDPFEKLDLMRASSCDYIVFWNSGPVEFENGILYTP